jgi:hypothetical protein
MAFMAHMLKDQPIRAVAVIASFFAVFKIIQMRLGAMGALGTNERRWHDMI